MMSLCEDHIEKFMCPEVEEHTRPFYSRKTTVGETHWLQVECNEKII